MSDPVLYEWSGEFTETNCWDALWVAVALGFGLIVAALYLYRVFRNRRPSKRRWFRFSLRWLFVVTAIVALCLGLLVAVRQAFEGPRGPVEDRAEWPQPLQHLLVQASNAEINAEPIWVYCTQDYTERFYYWRMDASPQLIALMVGEWGLHPGTQSDLDRFRRWYPDDWETLSKGRQRCLANSGNKGDNYIMMVDDTRLVVYGYYYFNF